MVASGVEIAERQEGDSDVTERQADYIQGSLAANGFDPVDGDVLAVLSQEQASELLDQVETIRVADTDEATEGRLGTPMWIIFGVFAFVLVLIEVLMMARV
jgi:hypothetical protein